MDARALVRSDPANGIGGGRPRRRVRPIRDSQPSIWRTIAGFTALTYPSPDRRWGGLWQGIQRFLQYDWQEVGALGCSGGFQA